MHGIIYTQLQQFIVSQYDYQTWFQILDMAGLKNRSYYPAQIYHDMEAQAIVAAICKKFDLSESRVLENFGLYISANLLKIYSSSINPSWKLLDLLEHTEDEMHKAVRFADKNASPPALVCRRTSPDQVILEYSSPRKMIDLGIGIIKGFADHYKENIIIDRLETDGKVILTITLARF
ncbi:MAG: heme NO-binding domain-containing protein [Bacteroidota bacterium]